MVELGCVDGQWYPLGRNILSDPHLTSGSYSAARFYTWTNMRISLLSLAHQLQEGLS